METQKLLFLIFICSSISLLLGIEVVQCSKDGRHGPKMLFVFGDSYADTGNDRNPTAPSWIMPYGITFPGKPSGRWSDGRVLTDFLAKFLRLKSPIPYIWRKYMDSHPKHGMNFAYGGTGVFDTGVPYPNMTTQIDIFEGLINQGMFSRQDLEYSVAHVSLVGNDYSYYLANGGTFQGLPTYIPQVVNQLVINLLRIKKMGIRKISVTNLQPLGCLPRTSYLTNFTKCDELSNNATQFHNLILQNALSKLNNQTGKSATSFPFITFDLYKAFSTILLAPQVEQGEPRFKTPLAPCCNGLNSTYYCGDLDTKGNKLYTLCPNPKSYFFWDTSHPTQAGWRAVLPSLESSIQQLFY